jgi:hypothetical protein
MNFILLGLGAALTIYAIMRFTGLKHRFTQPTVVLGFSLSAETVTLLYFILGLTMVILFLVTEIQPLFYKGRELQYNIRGY